MQDSTGLQDWQEWSQGQSALDILQKIDQEYGERAVLSTSFGSEDQVLTHMIRTNRLSIGIFALDTGRNFEETYYAMAMTVARFGPIQVFAPQTADIEDLLERRGPISFFESIENRKECCYLRKVKPLGRALQGKSAWIAGIRREQSISRRDRLAFEWEAERSLLKVHPLIDWSEAQIWDYIREHDIPYNELHDRGFPSIGCAPCTRAVKPGEDFRAGRWWWENNDQECGLHVSERGPGEADAKDRLPV